MKTTLLFPVFGKDRIDGSMGLDTCSKCGVHPQEFLTGRRMFKGEPLQKVLLRGDGKNSGRAPAGTRCHLTL